MARRVTWGTPGRSSHYIFPRGKWAFLLPAISVSFEPDRAWRRVALDDSPAEVAR